MKKIINCNAEIVAAQRVTVIQWLRQNTTLSEEDIIEKIIDPLDKTSFQAGFEIGYAQAVCLINLFLRELAIYKVIIFMLSAAVIAWGVWKILVGSALISI